MFCWVHFSSARRTATNGPNPDCIPARKRLTPSSPLRLVLEGDEVIASDDAVMALAITFADEARRSAMLILASPQHDNLQSLRDVRRSLPPPFAPTNCRQILRSQGLAFSRAPLRAADSRLERGTRLRAGSTRRRRRRVAHQGPQSSAPHHSRPLSRRPCVDVASRMLSENFDGAPFVLSIPSPHP
jgi:hypothetical protein